MTDSFKKLVLAVSLSIFLFNAKIQPVIAIEHEFEKETTEEASVQSEDKIESSEKNIPPETEFAQDSVTTKESEKEYTSDKKDSSDGNSINQETESDRIADYRNGSWGSVQWTWEESTHTITLQGGTSGSAGSAPWRKHTNVVRIIVTDRVMLPADSVSLFSALPNLERIENEGRFDTSNVTNMYNMFGGSSNLKSLDLSNWDTSNVTNMSFMFNANTSLETVDVSNLNTSNVTSMRAMFQGASSITSLDVSNWDTSNVTDMRLMFQSSNQLTVVDVSNWNTTNVVDMVQMFAGTNQLTTLDLSNWNTTNVSSASNMFTGTRNLSAIRLGTSSRFDHLTSPPTMPSISSSDKYTGSWVYYLNHTDEVPEAYITSSSASFWHEYDGTDPGVYQWQTKGTVTVYYKDIRNQELISPKWITGGIRAPFQVEETVIEGYTLKKHTDITSGRFNEDEQVIIFQYIKDKLDPVDPLNPEAEVDPENKPEIPENQGLLSIDFVSSFNFGSQSISIHDQTYYAQTQKLLNEDGTVNEIEERPNYVQITDRRPEDERNGWELAITQKEQFRGEENQVLNGASLSLLNPQVITAQDGTAPELHPANCELIPGNRRTLLKAQDNEGAGTWIYRLGDERTAEESISLNVPRGANPEQTIYSTTLLWELSIVPEN